MSDPNGGKRRSSSTVTIHDVARLAEVSLMTVSRAFNDPGRLSPVTLKRVMEAVAKTGYIPNLMAGGLRSLKTGLVAALVPTLMGQLFTEMIQSLTDHLASKGYQVMLGQIGYSESREDELLRAIIGRRPDGIVITGVMHSSDARRLLLGSGIPVVETWDFTSTPIDMLVGLSHEHLGQDVCFFLARQGRKRLALISGDDQRAAQRKKGFLRAAQSLGLESPSVFLVSSPTNHASGRAAMSALLSQHSKFDAVWCSSDMLAIGVITEAQIRGISIPGTMSVIGFGDLDFAETYNPALTTVRIDGTLMGRIAAQFIVDRVEGREVDDKVRDIGFSIVQRESA